MEKYSRITDAFSGFCFPSPHAATSNREFLVDICSRFNEWAKEATKIQLLVLFQSTQQKLLLNVSTPRVKLIKKWIVFDGRT